MYIFRKQQKKVFFLVIGPLRDQTTNKKELFLKFEKNSEKKDDH